MHNSRPVYSTDKGRLCPDCHQPLTACQCKNTVSAVKGDGKVRVSRETKGRKGKGVTLVSGLALTDEELKQLASTLKHLCGTGGTVKEGVIEIQGEHRDRLLLWLQQNGYQAKKAGA